MRIADAGDRELLRSVRLVATVWLILLWPHPFEPAVGMAVALAVVLIARRPLRVDRGALARCSGGLLLGLVLGPIWIAFVVRGGSMLGLPPPIPSPPLGASEWISAAVLAPVFEEFLYRERLLPALERRFGMAPAIAVSSLAFALPHIDTWSIWTTFLTGCALAGVYLRTRRVGGCIGFHAGLNLAHAGLAASIAA